MAALKLPTRPIQTFHGGTLRNVSWTYKREKALEIWEEMKNIKIIPTVSTFNALIGGLCHNGKTELAMERFDELAESGLFAS